MTTAAAIMADLAVHGIEVQAHVDRLRFKPKSAMTPELAERVKPHNGDLPVILKPAVESAHPESRPRP